MNGLGLTQPWFEKSGPVKLPGRNQPRGRRGLGGNEDDKSFDGVMAGKTAAGTQSPVVRADEPLEIVKL